MKNLENKNRNEGIDKQTISEQEVNKIVYESKMENLANDRIKNIGEKYNFIKEKAKTIVSGAAKLPGKIWGGLKGLWNSASEKLLATGEQAGEELTDIGKYVLTIDERAKNVLSQDWEKTQKHVTGAKDYLKGDWEKTKTHRDNAVKFIDKKWTGAKEYGKEVLGVAVDTVEDMKKGVDEVVQYCGMSLYAGKKLVDKSRNVITKDIPKKYEEISVNVITKYNEFIDGKIDQLKQLQERYHEKQKLIEQKNSISKECAELNAKRKAYEYAIAMLKDIGNKQAVSEIEKHLDEHVKIENSKQLEKDELAKKLSTFSLYK